METGKRVRSRLEEVRPSETHANVARAVGMKPDAFSRALNGHRGFSAVELAGLAEYLDVSMYWLATGEPDPNELRLVARHAFDHGSMTRSADWVALDRVMDTVALAYRQADTKRRSLEVEEDAARVRTRLGDGFVRCFAERLEAEYLIDVIKLKGISSACSTTINGQVVIVLNETGNWFHQNWSLAHELGHVAYGHGDFDERDVTSATDVREARANAFAAELLLPQGELERIDWKVVSGSSIADLLWSKGVSTHALRTRLSSLKIETSAHVSEILTWTTQKVLRRFPDWNADGRDQVTERMDEAAARRFPIKLQTAHIALIEQGKLPKTTLAWMLDVDPEDVEIEGPDEPAPDIDELARLLGHSVP